jgi:hypothetical protein
MKVRLWLAGLAMALFTVGAGAAIAQEHHEDEHHEHHWDAHNPRFDDHEHAVVRTWWGTHHDHPPIGFREEDRHWWTPDIRVGFVFGPEWRPRLHPVPADLYGELPPPPPHYHYYVLGGHVVLVDRNWRVVDVLDIDV